MADRLAKLEKAFRQHPDLPLFARLADQYLRRGMIRKALELCEKGCARFPDYPAGFVVLGRCLEARHDMPAARKAMGHALSLDPDNPAGFKRLASICAQLGDQALARKALMRAGHLDPLDEQVIQELDQLEYAQRLEAVCPAPVPYDDLPGEEEIRAASRPHVASPSPDGAKAAPGPPVASLPVDAADTASELQAGPLSPDAAEAAPGDASGDRTQSSVTRPFAARDSTAAVSADAHDPVDAVADLARSVNMEEDAAPDASADAHDPPDAVADAHDPVDAVADLARSVNMEEDAAPEREEMAPEPSVNVGPRDLELIGLAADDQQQLVQVLHEIQETPEPLESEQPEPPASDSESANELPEAESPVTQIATATLAEIYCLQGLSGQAVRIYQRLLQEDPNNQKFQKRLVELQQHGSINNTSRPQETR